MNPDSFQEITAPASRFCLRRCQGVNIADYDQQLWQLDKTIENHPGLHHGHYMASLFFDHESLKKGELSDFYAAFEVIGQGEELLDGETLLRDLPEQQWLSSQNLASELAMANNEQFNESVFNFLRFLHNKGYPEEFGARIYLEFKAEQKMAFPQVFVQISKTAIDIIGKEK